MAIKCYIVDDQISVVKILEKIISHKSICDVVGVACDSKIAYDEILQYEPDIVLIDLLMPEIDGITLVKKIKEKNGHIRFVMVSQVHSAQMISAAYKHGVEFYIRKPINGIEVESVLKKIVEEIELKNTFDSIKAMMGGGGSINSKAIDEKTKKIKDIKYVLGQLGILGEKGTKDILNLITILLEKSEDYTKETLVEYAANLGDDERMVSQRMRRAMKKALNNVAHVAIEDHFSETYQTYGQLVFEFESIKVEMEYIKGKGLAMGKINVGKFVDGLLTYSQINE